MRSWLPPGSLGLLPGVTGFALLVHIAFTDHLVGRVWTSSPCPLLVSGLWVPKQHVEASPRCTERVFGKVFLGSRPIAPGHTALASPHLSGPWVGYGDEKSCPAQRRSIRVPRHIRWRAASWGPAATLTPAPHFQHPSPLSCSHPTAPLSSPAPGEQPLPPLPEAAKEK